MFGVWRSELTAQRDGVLTGARLVGSGDGGWVRPRLVESGGGQGWTSTSSQLSSQEPMLFNR